MNDVVGQAVVVFAPSPLITVTIEDLAGNADIHVHAGGQGMWQARMIASLGVPVTLCAALGGETGGVLEHLIPGEGVRLASVPVSARNGGYVQDARGETRTELACAPGEALGRHELDALYEITLTHGLEQGIVLLSGPHCDLLPASIYRRLASDLSANGCTVLADLSGPRLEATLAGGPAVVKVSHEELIADGRATSDDRDALVQAMYQLRADGAGTVVVSCAADPALALVGETAYDVHAPPLVPAESMGAGDSMTAGIAASLARGTEIVEAVRGGAACGALNVVRQGLGTGGPDAVAALADRVQVQARNAGC